MRKATHLAWPGRRGGARLVDELRLAEVHSLLVDLELVFVRAAGVGDAVDEVPNAVVGPIRSVCVQLERGSDGDANPVPGVVRLELEVLEGFVETLPAEVALQVLADGVLADLVDLLFGVGEQDAGVFV